jgi:hypothetical protein
VWHSSDLLSRVHRDVKGLHSVDGHYNAHIAQIEGIGAKPKVHGQLVNAEVRTIADNEKGSHLSVVGQPAIQLCVNGRADGVLSDDAK